MDECCEDVSIVLVIFIFRFLFGFAIDIIVFGFGVLSNWPLAIAGQYRILDLNTAQYCHRINLRGYGGFHH